MKNKMDATLIYDAKTGGETVKIEGSEAGATMGITMLAAALALSTGRTAGEMAKSLQNYWVDHRGLEIAMRKQKGEDADDIRKEVLSGLMEELSGCMEELKKRVMGDEETK